MTRKRNWWLTGIFGFAGVIFGTLAFVSFRAYQFRGEGYYMASVVVYGGVALCSLVAVIGGWGNWLPGMRRQEPPAGANDGDAPTKEG